MPERDPKLEAIERFFAAYAAGDLGGIRGVLSAEIEWAIPGHHPLAGTKHGIDEVLAFFDQLAKTGFQAEPIFLEANDEYVPTHPDRPRAYRLVRSPQRVGRATPPRHCRSPQRL